MVLNKVLDLVSRENSLLLTKPLSGSSHHGAVEMNLTRNHEVVGSIPGLARGVRDPVLLWVVV